MRTYRKYFVLGLFFVLIGASVSITATTQKNITIKNPSYSGRGWSDDFSSYTLGQFLDGDPTDGGWKGWDNDPTYGAFVVDDKEHSIPHSVEIVDQVDLVHEFSGYTSGQWTFIAWQYIPEDFFGNTYFILLCDYEDGAGQSNTWALQLRFDSDNQIVESEFDTISLPLITGRWVELRTEIDLDTDWFQFYYDGDLLIEKAWTATINNDGSGYLVIDAVDLYANAATVVYYDDLSLTGETPIPSLCCQGDIRFEYVGAGKQLTDTFQVSNCGDDGSELDWEITEWPTWGTGWTFNPPSGTGLTPTQGWIDVDVTFNAPNEKNKPFNGIIKVINSNNPAEYCEIDVYVLTPRTKQYMNNPFINFLKNHENMFPILQRLLKGLGLY